MKTKRYLQIFTDQYTGNIDSILVGMLFGIDDGRYLGWESAELFEKMVTNENDRNFINDVVQGEPHPDSEYGQTYNMVQVGEDYTGLEVVIDEYVTLEEIKKCVKILRKYFDDKIYGPEETYGKRTSKKIIKILGYKIRAEEIHETSVDL
jgi:hypothetical protein